MIRILHAIDTTGPGGAETVFINLIKNMDKRHFKPYPVISGPGWIYETLLKAGGHPIFVSSRGGFNINYLLSLVKIIRRHRIHIVQSHLLGSNVYCSLAGLICRIPVISTFHGFVDASTDERNMAFKTILINLGSSKIVYVSERLRSHYVKKYGFSSKKSVVVYNGVDTSIFIPQKDKSIRHELGIGADNVLIGALGNIRPAKGYDIFLKAARIIHEKHPQCRFLIAGQGYGPLNDSIRNLRNDLGLEKVFFFLGFREDTARLINNLDIFVLPSISEGFSISTIEALACGVPVVVTRSGGPQEIICNGETGVLVEVGSADRIADGIDVLIENKGLYQSLSVAGTLLAKKRFSVNAMVGEYQSIFRKLATCGD